MSIKWFDGLLINTRRDADVSVLVLTAINPSKTEEDKHEEVCRVITSNRCLKPIIRLMCEQLDYWPNKPEKCWKE